MTMSRDQSPARTRHHRAGFTAVEIMIVLGIIIALAAMSVGAYQAYMAKSRIDATKYLLQQIVLGMQAYGVQRWSIDPITIAAGTMWGLNTTPIPSPAVTPAPVPYGPEVDASGDPGLPSSYTGFLRLTGTTVQSRYIKSGDQIYDAWGVQRIRVIPRASLPDGVAFGVMSAGPDKILGNTDDISSL
jgi:type II secretory pathway pseudopilin PulG